MPARILPIAAALIALALVPSSALAAPKKTFVRFSSTAYSVTENGGTFNLTVLRSGNTSGTTSATVTVAGGTATAPANYTLPAATASVTFNPGQTSKTVPVTINDDTVFSGANKT